MYCLQSYSNKTHIIKLQIRSRNQNSKLPRDMTAIEIEHSRGISHEIRYFDPCIVN